MTNDYDSHDFEAFIEKTQNSVPDGLFDASVYVSRIEDVVDAIRSVEDIRSEKGRIMSMMRTSEICFADSEGSLAVCYLLTLILSSLDDLVEGSYENLLQSLKEDILPKLKESQSSVPYWK